MAHLLNSFANNTRGNVGMTFGLMALPLIIGAGVAIDYAMVNNLDQKAQYIADAVSLRAAIYVDSNGAEPQSVEDGIVGGHVYMAIELGFDSGNTDLEVVATYVTESDEVIVDVTGKMPAIFMEIVGIKDVPFGASATANYGRSTSTSPLSVFFVVDNSGSMKWDDHLDLKTSDDYNERTSMVPGAGPRLTSLKSTSKDFMDTLSELNSTSASGKGTVRTALYPYASSIKTNARVVPSWGVIADHKIDKMVASGGTNSWPPMQEAKNEMRDEDNYFDEGSDPKKYVVFMTDGVNNPTGTVCETVASEGHYHWRRWDMDTGTYEISESDPGRLQYVFDTSNGDPDPSDVAEKELAAEDLEAYLKEIEDFTKDVADAQKDVTDQEGRVQDKVDSKNAEIEKYNLIYAEYSDLVDDYNSTYGGSNPYSNGTNAWDDYEKAKEDMEKDIADLQDDLTNQQGKVDDKQVDIDKEVVKLNEREAILLSARNDLYDAQANYNAFFQWEKVWVDGKQEKVCKPVSTYDEKTLGECSAMKAEGVEIYTIGYALAPGRYHRNDGNLWANKEYDRYHFVMDEDTSERAYALLQTCATSPDHHFFKAEDATELSEAFSAIGDNIRGEMNIRITN